MNINPTKPSKGLHLDNHSTEQPKDTYRFALNSMIESKDGEQGILHNEESNYSCSPLPEGFVVLGDKYLEDNTSVVMLKNPTTNREEIGLLRKDNIYQTLINTQVFGFDIAHQIDITYRLRRGNEKVIYWVDGLNNVRNLNLDRLPNYYTQTYKNYLEAGGDSDTYPDEKWDLNSFNLIKTYSSVPYFWDVEVLDYGNIKPGSYNFAIQYLDDDLNPTEWISVSNTVNIYNDSFANPYGNIRGAFNNPDNPYQVFGVANKTIKLKLAGLDTASFPFYRVAIIQATSGTGEITKVLASQQQSTSVGTFIYSGNDTHLEEIDVNEIRFDKEYIRKPQHIEQIENRLVLANGEGSPYNWCEFQQYASKIDTQLVTEKVVLNSVVSPPNIKNAKSSFFYHGYMPGEVYSFGIVYLMRDMTLSPVFHIPGKGEDNLTSNMGVYLSSYTYPDIHNCITNNYWGKDVMENNLVGELVRHHKFPSRREAEIPLVTNTDSTIEYTRYVLKVRFTLKAGQSYPTDIDGDPIVIDYQINFQPTGESVLNYNNVLTISQLGSYIEVYNALEAPLDEIDPPNYGILDPSCELATDYMLPGNEVFDIEYSYEETNDDTVYEVSESEIFGIQFLQVEKPHEDVIGFYIVRNEVTDEDKLVIDNCIVGPNINSKEYRAFTHISPIFSTSVFDEDSVWYFSPESIYKTKHIGFNDLYSQGYFETNPDIPNPVNSSLRFSRATEENGDDAGGDNIEGVYIEDVQAGTSYNAEVHKKRDKDSDGFSLQCAYKNVMYKFFPEYIELGEISDSFLLNAATNKIKNQTNYYNVSIDNKISMAVLNIPYDTDEMQNSNLYNISIPGGNTVIAPGSRLIYATMRRGMYIEGEWVDMPTAYQDFLTRPYYKEHMRPFLFGEDTIINSPEIYNGDVYISGFNFINTVFNQVKVEERRNKTNLWKYIIGAVLIVVGVVASIFSAGSSAALAVIGASMIVAAAGISLISAGLKSDQMIAMWEEHYDKGLLECVNDNAVKGFSTDIHVGDDCIQWFADRASNLYIESRVPFGLRAGLSADIPDFVDGPGPYNDGVFYNYLTEKLTYFDREQGGGRMYRGFATAEFYSCNPDYWRFSKEKSYIHLPVNYDCCTDNTTEKFPTRIWYSEQSFQEERTDNYRSFLVNNYKDIEGENGEITDLYKIGNSLMVVSKEARWQVVPNNQERVSNELTTYIGTGEFLAIPPKKIIDDNLGSAGSQHKWATLKTKYGVFSVNEIENKIHLHSEGLKDISLVGLKSWFENNLSPNITQQFFDLVGEQFPLYNNPANGVGVGYISCYDTRYDRVLFTKRDFNIINATLYVGEMNYTATIPDSEITIVGFNSETQKFHLGKTQGETLVFRENSINKFEEYPKFFQNKSWTISFNLQTNTWISWHSYLPNYYIHNQGSFYSCIFGNYNIWKHNQSNSYQTYYNILYPHIIEYISNSNPLVTRIWEDLRFITIAKRYDSTSLSEYEERKITHNKIILSNNRQCSGVLSMKTKDENPNYYFQQVSNVPGQILIDRNERDWSINQLRDYVVDPSLPFFSYRWQDLQSTYYIDKQVIPTNISYTKNWDELESFRDKYLAIRLIFDNFADVKLSTQFSLETENESER